MFLPARIPLVIAVVLVVSAGAVSASAQTPTPTPTPRSSTTDPTIVDGSAQQRLDRARGHWKAAGLRSYRMRVRHSCFCSPAVTSPASVVVLGGRIAHAPRRVRAVATVPRAFAKIQLAIDHRYAGLRVTYGAHGVPRRVGLDPDSRIADEEDTYEVLKFIRLGH